MNDDVDTGRGKIVGKKSVPIRSVDKLNLFGHGFIGFVGWLSNT